MVDRRRRKSAPVRRGPNLRELWLPALLFLALLVAAIVVAGAQHRRKTQQAEALSEAESPLHPESEPHPDSVPEHVPFRSVPGPEATVWRSRIRSESEDEEADGEERPARPAEGLLARPVWTQAVGWAEEAQSRLDEAKACREGGDVDGFRENGRKAKKLFQKALDSTDAFYENVVREHGEIDSEVSSIRRTRAAWQEKHLALHKLIRF